MIGELIGIYVARGRKLFSVKEALSQGLPGAVRHSERTLVWRNMFIALEDVDGDPSNVGADRYLNFPEYISIFPRAELTADEIKGVTRSVLDILKNRGANYVLVGDLEDDFPTENTDAFAERELRRDQAD